MLLLWAPLYACEDECGSEPALAYFDVEGANLFALNSPANQTSRSIVPNESVSRPNLLLAMSLPVRYYSSAPARGGNRAYACSPLEPGQLGTDERVDSLTIRSRFDYDAQHPAGSSLNDLVALDYLPSGLILEPNRIAEANGQPLKQLNFRLRRAPTASGPQQFRVRLRLTNGEVYTAETVSFTLLP
ncbi:hypothetical protein GCM10023186_02810 [Hymenobacter koreensis]|uniref:DUF5034 domain-containing protein n=1 Tax=Hymenobacter koreensis TaxID=1084523 RepID=A0ABP8IU16_9BACT